MKAALYCRVSTTHQDSDMQLSELRQYAQARGLDIFREYNDQVSGAKESRPGLNRLLSDAKLRKFDVVLCWKLDRMGRSLRHLVNLLADFDALGVGFISLRDSMDLTTPSGKLMFHVIAAMAEFERALITERVRAGVKRAKQQGIVLGRRFRVFNKDQVKALRAEGKSWRQIEAQLGVSHETLRKRTA